MRAEFSSTLEAKTARNLGEKHIHTRPTSYATGLFWAPLSPIDESEARVHIRAVNSPNDPNLETAPPQVVELAQRCVEACFRTYKFTLDYSEVSLAMLDHYVRNVPSDKPEIVALVARIAGAYFGEVSRLRLNGKWVMSTPEPESWRVQLPTCPLSWNPVGMAAEAITMGELEGYDGAIDVGSETAWLEETLAGSAELPVETYFSLTGRYETLLHIADLLHEAKRQDEDDEGDDELGEGDVGDESDDEVGEGEVGDAELESKKDPN